MAEVKAVSPVKEIPDRVHAVAGRENVRSESEKETENVTASGIGDGEAGRGELRAGGGRDILLGNLSVGTSTGLENENENGNVDANEELDEPQDEDTRQYLSGWKLHMLTIGIWISLFLSTLETTIVSTSLVSITNALDGFQVRDWIVTAYLITYTGFLVIYAKFSDVFGKKTMLILALGIFTLFSILCGAATGVVELSDLINHRIIFRAFQGIGASGIYSMIMAIAPTMVPEKEFGTYIAIVSTVFVVASVLGPILGGAINSHTTWRWVFLLNAPGGSISLILIALFLPSSQPTSATTLLAHIRAKFTRTTFARIDVLGTIFLLAFSVLLVFALEEAGSRYAWGSPVIIITFVISILAGTAFVGWEWWVERVAGKQEPTFPLSLLRDRVLACMMATAFFIGFPFVAIVVNIPQRAQALYGFTPLRAGLALLPLLLTSPLATAVSGFLTSNRKVPPLYLILGGAVLQVIGVGLTCSLPVDATRIPAAQYGYEVLMGIGFGAGLSTLLTLARLVVDERNLPVAMGALTQVRVLGGTISLAICSTILNTHLRPQLSLLVTPSQAAAISDNISAIHTLSTEQQAGVRRAFAVGYNRQNVFLAALTGVGLLTSLGLVERRPRRVR
ncbi:Efflux pump [Lachnellula hyalina]|uniref:Efflux pump n=1 Tax=Lachnellula hyalina TaxID=1316788 RepID=A0A8H8R4F0_9HELO|nr:Efflux pump [Lachnellula hyalina]TVY27456.1 Efflux pump [Lachnellula hyalina]